MKATLEFDIENIDTDIRERELEKMRCARKGYYMSGFIDSFLDYLIVVAPHIPMDKLLPTILDMYYNKLEQCNIIDMLEDELREVVAEWEYVQEADEQADEIMDEAYENYLKKRCKTAKKK